MAGTVSRPVGKPEYEHKHAKPLHLASAGLIVVAVLVVLLLVSGGGGNDSGGAGGY